MADQHDRDNHAIDAFADALDAITLGLPVPGSASDPLAAFAANLAQIGQPIPADEEAVPGTRLSASAKRQIWSALMAGHGVHRETAPRPATPGAAGSALALNPWSPRQSPGRPRGHRPSGSALRYLPAVQPSSTFLMVVLVLVMVGASFAWIAPESGFAPGASATESAATPEATPEAAIGDCSWAPDTHIDNPVRDYGYRQVAPVDMATLASAVVTMSMFTACLESPGTMATPRFVEEFSGTINLQYAGKDRRLSELTSYWVRPIGKPGDIVTVPWFPGSDGNLNLLEGTAWVLNDHRIGILASITHGTTSPIPDASWIASDASQDDDPVMVFFAFARHDQGLVIDELAFLCAGQRCIDAFSPDRSIATPAYQPDVVDSPCVKQFNEYWPDPEVSPRYDRVGPMQSLFRNDIDRLFRDYSGCSDNGDAALSTFRDARYTDATNAETTRIASELNQTLTQPLDSQQDLRRYTWHLVEGSVRVLNVFAGTASTFGDGRVGVLTTLTDETASPYPDDSWQDYGSVAGVTTPVVQMYFLIPIGHMVIDEVVTLCAGASCIDLYGADAVPQFATPTSATPVASPVVGGKDCDLGARAASALPDRMYRSAGTLLGENPDALAVRSLWEQVLVCGTVTDGTVDVPASLSTGRRTEDRANGLPDNAWALTYEEEGPLLGASPGDDALASLAQVYGEIDPSQPVRATDLLTIELDLMVLQNLVDGRIAIYSGDYWLRRESMIGDSTYATSGELLTLHIFASSDGRWLYDETLRLCTGICQGFVSSGAEKPPLIARNVVFVDPRWHMPSTSYSPDCDPALATLPSPQTSGTQTQEPPFEPDPANYMPYGPADPRDQVAVAETYAALTMPCGIWTSWANPIDGLPLAPLGIPTDPEATRSQIETAAAISDALDVTDPISITFNDPVPASTAADLASYRYILLSTDIVQLPDGRLGGMTRLVVTAPSSSPHVIGGMTTVPFIVFRPEGNGWNVDEIFMACVGACEDYWNNTTGVPGTGPATATAAASPDAEMMWRASLYQPVTADECVVGSRSRDEMSDLLSTPAAIPDRLYEPAIPVNHATEDRVIAAARAWYACANYGLPSQRMALESPAYIWEQSGRTRHDDPARFEARQAATRSFSETLLDPDWTTYYIETDGVDVLALSGQRSIVQPGHVWLLSDGRVGAVVSQLVPPGTHEERASWPEHTVEFQIFTLDGGQWLLDETLWLCPGGCEVAPDVVSASPVAGTPEDSCMTTEVHNEPISAPWLTDDQLRTLPRIEVDTGSSELILLGLLWYGDRPLEPDGVFPADGMSAKLMWVSSVTIADLEISARPVAEPASTPVVITPSGANASAEGPASMWPSTMALPGVGCWEVTLMATVAETGEPVTGTVIMEVVAPPPATPES